MLKVKEIAKLSGVSVRTLHYYDEIGILNPTKITEKGHKLYDEQTLTTLQHILFFKELGVPLKKVKDLLLNPNFSDIRIILLEEQKQLLTLKRNHLNELLQLIDNLIKGVNFMSFKEFDTTQIDKMFDDMIKKLNDKTLKSYIEMHGNLENARKTFEENLMKNQEDLNRYIVNEEDIANMLNNSISEDKLKTNQDKIDDLNKQLFQLMDKGYDSKEVQKLIQEIKEANKELLNMSNIENLFYDMGKLYLENDDASNSYDQTYGEGYGKFFGNAILYSYNKNEVC